MASFDVNRVILRGRVGQKPETKLGENFKRTVLSVATSERWAEEEERTDWHRVVCWSEHAIEASRLVVGQAVLVEGSLRHRSWEEPDGTKRYATEVVALSIVGLARPKAKEKQAPPVAASDVPFDVQEGGDQ